jgi:hypothetical protein
LVFWKAKHSGYFFAAFFAVLPAALKVSLPELLSCYCWAFFVVLPADVFVSDVVWQQAGWQVCSVRLQRVFFAADYPDLQKKVADHLKDDDIPG